MFAGHFRSSGPARHAAVLLLLTLLCFGLAAAPVSASTSDTPTLTAPAFASTVFDDVFSNRTRMIQIACVVGAIGIFFLTMSYRS
jgi:hypothetical protein